MANNFQVPASSGSGGATSPGGCAIFGDNPVPYACSAFASSGDALTTGDLVVGDAGEVSGLVGFAIEFWVNTTGAFPGSKQYIALGPVSTAAAVREWAIAISAGNAITFEVVDDAGGVHSVTTGGVMSAGVWYHVVCTAEGGSVRNYLNGVADGVDATWGSHTVRPAAGTAGTSDFKLQMPYAGGGLQFDEVATYRTGLTAARVLAHYNAGVNMGRKAENSGTRIIALLDACSSHAPRSIQAGARSVVPRYYSGQSPISEIRMAVEADDVDAGFFVAADGTLTFLADGHRSSSPYNTSQATFGDGGGAELPYLDITMDYSETFLINEWNVTRTPYQQNTPVTQTVSDATSISRYFKRSQSLSDCPTTQDSDASTIATELVAKYKDPMQRVTSIKPNMADVTTAFTVYQLELMERITVKRRPPGGGSAISQDAFIQSIEMSGTPGVPPSVTLGVSPL